MFESKDHILNCIIMDDVQKMDNALVHFEKLTTKNVKGSPNMLDNVTVDAYGSKTPLNQLGNISIPDQIQLQYKYGIVV